VNQGTCRGCGAPVLFVTSAVSGKAMPLNQRAEKRLVVGEDGKARVVDTYLSHFSTCPKADEFRRKPKPVASAIESVLRDVKPEE
jgi:hypothetical protein